MTGPTDDLADQTLRLTEIDGLDLVQLLSDGENPLVTCEEESNQACPYKREYGKRLERYNIESLMRWPECESCGCPMVVVRDAA